MRFSGPILGGRGGVVDEVPSIRGGGSWCVFPGPMYFQERCRTPMTSSAVRCMVYIEPVEPPLPEGGGSISNLGGSMYGIWCMYAISYMVY